MNDGVGIITIGIKMKLPWLALCGGMLFLLDGKGYAMQPPPPPLNIARFQELIEEADVIAVGKIGRTEKSEALTGSGKDTTVIVALDVEKTLKGELANKIIHIRELYPALDSVTSEPASRENKHAQGEIVTTRAGPRQYHGSYVEGARIIVFLKGIEGTGEYKLLGSGTYTGHLCEFLIENDSVKTLYVKTI